MKVFLVHHGDAVGPEVDAQRPLSTAGAMEVAALAAEAARRGVKPAVVWHSGKLRAKQTAEAFWRACNPFADLTATRDLQPGDPPGFMRDRLRGEMRDLMIVGHFPHLPLLLAALLATDTATFPQHGVVALESQDAGESWSEAWRLEAGS